MFYSWVLYIVFWGACGSVGRTVANRGTGSICSAHYEYLKPQTVSTYNYELVVKGAATRQPDVQIGLSLNCDFRVESTTNCSHTLKISKCELHELDLMSGHRQSKKCHHDSDVFSSAMSRYPLSFYLQNGSVAGIFARDDEVLAMLNLKRGIISSLMTRKPADEEVQSVEMRTDVQGTCPVIYKKVDANRLHMSKNMSECHFPSKFDWPYSPFSLFWNMSFVQMFLISSKAECSYVFSQDGLKSTVCDETHAVDMESDDDKPITVQAEIKQVLTLSMVSRHSVNSIATLPTMKSIEYEYERSFVPTKASPYLNSQVGDLITLLVNSSKVPIEAEAINHFIVLVDTLRSASDLKQTEEEIISCINIPSIDCTSNEKARAVNYFVDALVHCNSLPCIRSFRRVVEKKHYVAHAYLVSVLLSWNFLKITDPDFFHEIQAICSLKQTQLCPFVLSSAIHTFWMRDKHLYKAKPLPTGITNSLQYIFHLIGDRCDKDETLVIVGLKALGNLGSISQTYKPEIEETLHSCVVNARLSWAVRLEAIDAFRKFAPSTNLYNRLLSYLHSSALNVDMRVLAYKILADISFNQRFMNDLVKFLEFEESYQLKTFIRFHLKSILTRRDFESAKYAKIIRRAELDRLLSLESLPNRHQVSSHVEKSSFYKIPFLPDAINRIGGRIATSSIFSGEELLPLREILNVTFQLFGKDVNIFQLLQSTRGTAGTVAFLTEHFSEHVGTMNNVKLFAANFNSEVAKNLKLFLSKIDSPLKFGYAVDESVLKNLNRIRQHFDFDGSKDLKYLTAFRLFGDDLGFFTTQMLNSAVFKFHMLLPTLINKPHHSSGVTRILEAIHPIPTLGGIPLNWTSDVAFVHSLDVAFNFNVSALGGFVANVPFEFSGAAMMANKMLISLPGFIQGGVKMFNTASTSFDAAVMIRMQISEQNFAFIPPKREVRVLRMSRYGIVYNSQGEIEMEDSSVGKAEEFKCLDDLVPYTGVLLCRKKVNANVATESNKLYTLMGRGAVWELTADFPDRKLAKYTILFRNVNSPSGRNIDVIFKGRGGGRSRELLFSHVVNDTSNEYEAQFVISEADFRVKMSKKQNELNGFTTCVTAGFRSQSDYSLAYSTGKKEVYLVDDYSTVTARAVSVAVSENVLNITTPSALFSWNRTHQAFPHSNVVDHFFSYITSKDLPQYESILPEVVYETPQVAWLRLQHRLLFNETTFDAYRSYSYIKAPEAILEIQTLVNGRHTFHFNVTQRSLPSYKLKTFLNLSYVCKDESDSHHSTWGHFANLTVPRLSWAFESFRQLNATDLGYTWLLRRERMAAKNDRDSDMPVWWEPKSIRRFTAQSFDCKLHCHLRNVTSATKSQLGNSWVEVATGAFISLELPTWKPITIEGQLLRDPYRKYQLDFTLTNPDLNFQLESSNNLTLEPDAARRTWFKHNSVVTVLSSKRKFATHTVDGSLVSNKLKFTELLDSNFFVYQSNLLWDLTARDRSDLKLNISATSTVWKFLCLDLQQVVFDGGETMNMKHDLVDINVVGDWRNGYKKILTFNSKDPNIIPNMVWKVEYPHSSRLSALIKFSFPDSGLNVYAMARVSSDFKEVAITICKQALCDDLESEPNAVISQYVYSLDDSTHLAEIVTKNPKLIREMEDLWNKRMGKISEAVTTAISDRDHPVNKIMKPFLKTTIGSWIYTRVASVDTIVDHALHYLIEIISTLEPIYNPFLDLSLRLYLKATFSMYATLADTDYVWHLIAWPFSEVRRWVTKLSLMSLWETADAPGPVGGHSHVKIYTLPVVLQDFHLFRIQPRFNPAYIREKTKMDVFEFAAGLNGLKRTSPVHSLFYNPKYSRFALLFGSGRVRTFDGNVFNLIKNTRSSSKCSHLLIHNRVDGRVTVIREGPHLNFMFPQFKISLRSLDGRIFVNDSTRVKDVPIRSWDGFVNITRMGNIIEVETFYQLNVKCVINDFCVFSTTPLTYNHFVGLFGNNNWDPTDDIAVDYSGDGGPQSLFRLSLPSMCSDEEFDSCSGGTHSHSDCHQSFNPYGLTASDCQDVVPYDQFREKCEEDVGCNVSACVSIRPYEALCAAHNLPTKNSPECPVCTDGLQIVHTLEDVVEKRLEVIFLIDQWQRSSSAFFHKGLESLAASVEESFKSHGYRYVRFGLVGFRSLPDFYHWGQHSLNGKLMAPVDEFVQFGIKSLDFIKEDTRAPDPTITFKALKSAIEYYAFGSDTVRMFILVTPEDPVALVGADVTKDVLKGMKSLGASLYVLSDYPSLANHSFRGTMTTEVSNGQYSKLAVKTAGSLFPASTLSESRVQSHLRKLTNEMVTSLQQKVGLCRSCSCHSASYYLPRVNCREFKCKSG